MTEVTKEFAIAYLLDDCDDCPESKDGECMTRSHCFEVKQMAIMALRQGALRVIPENATNGDALDKIKAEIEELQTYKMFEGEDTVYIEHKDVLAIIDKYRAESED